MDTEPTAATRRDATTTLEEVASHGGRLPGHGLARRQRLAARSAPTSGRDVQAAIAELGYVPNRAARSLVTRRSDSIARGHHRADRPAVQRPVLPSPPARHQQRARARDLQLILLMPESVADEAERTADYLTAGHVDGASWSASMGTTRCPAASARPGCRSSWSGDHSKATKASYVDVDNRQGAQTAVAHLISGGRRVIATIAGPQDMAAGIDRLAGYRDGTGRRRPRRATRASRRSATSPRRAAPPR